MKHFILILFLLTFQNSINGQSLQWHKTFGGTSADFFQDFKTTSEGDIVFITTMYEQVDFDGTTILNTNGESDILLGKYAASGELEWAFNIGGPGYDFVYEVVLDEDDNIYIVGLTGTGDLDFDPSDDMTIITTEGDYQNLYAAKYNSNGDFQWVKRFGNIDTPFNPAELIIMENGDIVFSSDTESSFDADPGTETLTMDSNDRAVYLWRLDADGNLVWVKQFDDFQSDYMGDIATDGNGNIYLTGGFDGNIDLDPGSGIQLAENDGFGTTDGFLVKLDGAGNYLWSKNWGSDQLDSGIQLTTDQDNNVFMAGQFGATFTIDGTEVENMTETNDVFIAKFDSDGNILWTGSLGNENYEFIRDISIAPNNDLLITADFIGTMDFDMGSSIVNITSQDVDFYVTRYDNDGNYKWVFTSSSSGGENANKSYMTEDNMLCICGNFNETFDIGLYASTEVLTSNGSIDAFMACYDVTEVIIAVKDIELSINANVFPNPAKSEVTISDIDTKNVKQIHLVTGDGKMIPFNFQKNNNSIVSQVDLLSNGMYWLVIDYGTHKVSVPFSKH